MADVMSVPWSGSTPSPSWFLVDPVSVHLSTRFGRTRHCHSSCTVLEVRGEDLRALITRPQLVLLGHDEGRLLLYAEPEEFKTPPSTCTRRKGVGLRILPVQLLLRTWVWCLEPLGLPSRAGAFSVKTSPRPGPFRL